MSFDEMYDEMLHEEFSSCDKHQAQTMAVEPVQSSSRGRHAAADGPERPRGFQRYRTAALVGAGGLACAAAGAFLGGLGGYFSISPAAAHQVGASTITQDLPLAQAVDHAANSSSTGAHGTSAVAAAAQFSKVSGSLTQGIAPFATLTSLPLQNLPVTGIPGLYGGGTGGTGTGVIDSGTVDGTTTPTNPTNNGDPTGCTSGSNDLGLTCMLASLSGSLTNLGSVADPGGVLNTLPDLGGVLTNVTGALQGLTALLPIASLPLPTGGVPTTVLAGIGGGSLTGGPARTDSTSSNPVGALAPVLNTVGGLTGGLGSTPSPSLPSLPLPSSLPSLPLPSLPSIPSTGSTLPGLPVSLHSGTTAAPTVSTQSSGSSSGGSTTVNVPLPLPLPVPTQPVSIGGLSVGINSSGSTSGLTLTLP